MGIEVGKGGVKRVKRTEVGEKRKEAGSEEEERG